MLPEDFSRTQRKFKFLSVATLKEYSLAFTKYSLSRKGGVADIIPTPGSMVEGILYQVPNFNSLDKREGAPFIYYRTGVTVFDSKGIKIEVETYMVREKLYHHVAPARDYAQILLRGATPLSARYKAQLQRIIDIGS